MLKTRFAPSPTGNLHLGGARTALINYIVSKKSASSKFYLRIEDTDHERSKQEYTDNITNSLKWLGLNWDEEIQVQSKRLFRHQEIAKDLLQKKRAFKCVCSEEKITQQEDLQTRSIQEFNTDVKELHGRITDTQKELTALMTEQHQSQTQALVKLKEDISSLDKWRYMIIGGAIVVGFLIQSATNYIT